MANKMAPKAIPLEEILKKIVIQKTSAGKGNAGKTLFKMRYGNDWKKYYPLVG